MDKVESIEIKLNERIKELTCLYEVSSILVNSDYDQLGTSIEAIAHCLKKAWRYPGEAAVRIEVNSYKIAAGKKEKKLVNLQSEIRVFNEAAGTIEVGYPASTHTADDFLEEEQKLLDNVSLAIGNLLERKQIRDSEAAIKRQVERADRLNILGEITAGIAHELNTPLANILGFAELMRPSAGQGQMSRDLEKIVDSAIYCREVVKKLMFFACEMPQHMDKVAMKPILEDVLKLLGPALKKKNIKLVVAVDDGLPDLKADTIQLTQVLFNLIMNAVYFSPDSGELHIAVKRRQSGIRFQIADEGPGIAKEIEDKIYEPFFTTKALGEGSGLGLSVVHGIMSSHKGTISHKPNKPKGTVFILDFPI